MINSLIFKRDSKVRTTIMIVVAIIACFFLVQDNVRNEDNGYLKKVEYLKVATVVEGDIYLPQSLPYLHKSNKPFDMYFELNNYKYRDFTGRKAIAISCQYLNYKVYLGKNLVYEFKEDKSKILGSGGGSSFSIIDLPANKNDDMLKISFEPIVDIDSFLIQPIIFGERANIVLHSISNDYAGIILVTLSMLLAFVTLMIYFASYRIDVNRKKLLCISLSSIIVGVYVFSNLNITSYMFSEYVGLIYFLEYMSLIFFPYPLIKFIEDDVNQVIRSILKVCSILLFLNFFVQFSLVCFKILEFRQMLMATHMITILSFVNILLCIVFSEFETKMKKVVILLSVSPAYLGVILLYLEYKFYDHGLFIRLFALTMLLFVFIQLYMFVVNYIEMSKENMLLKVYRKMTSVDTLTGLNNRYALNNALADIRRNPKPVTIISIDLNNLKIINDTLGHSFGDKAIITVGNYLKENIPNADVFRIGGDEFLAISNDVLEEEELLKLNFKEIYIEGISEVIDITFSLGMCIFDMVNVQSVDEAIIVSDMRMYENKERIKNQRKKRYIFTRL